MASGVMVGYWQNMSRRAILAEVNAALGLLGLPQIAFNGEPAGLLHQADQVLTRPFEVSPYEFDYSESCDQASS
jgi:hypothetical protein